jgi:hypothetical protein
LICHLCRRAARGFAFAPPKDKQRRRWHFCSMQHLDFAYHHFRSTGQMIDPSPDERKAALAGGANAGEYLDSIGKSDLAALTAEEWEQFLLCVVGGYLESLATEDIPF